MQVPINFSVKKEKRALYEYLKNLNGLHIVTIEKTTRRLNWNNYYWKVIVGMGAEHQGCTPKEMHEEYKSRFAVVFDRDKKGVLELKSGSTKKMPQDVFEQYCEFCKMFNSIEFGFYTPDIWEMYEK